MTKKYSNFNLFIRSFIFLVISILLMAVYSIPTLFTVFFPLDSRFKFILPFIRFYMWLLEKICLIKYEVTGLENIPDPQSIVVLSKHSSTWEAFYLALTLKSPAMIAKRQLLLLPFFGWGLALSEPIAINRSNPASAMQQVIKKGGKCLAKGRPVVVFPEGTRIPYPKAGKYRLGGARLSAATGYPILPFAHNGGKYWGKRKFTKQPGTIKAAFGPLIYPENRSPDELTKLTQEWIENTIASFDGTSRN